MSGLEPRLNALMRKDRPGPPLVAFLGDSFMGGSSDVPAYMTIDRWCASVLGAIPVTSGQGGTGYLSSGTNNAATNTVFGSTERLSRLAAAKPDLLVIVGSINDDNWDANDDTRRTTVRDAASKTFDAVREHMPHVPVVVVGPQPSGGARAVARSVQDNVRGVADAVAARNDGFVFRDWLGPSYAEEVTAWAQDTEYTRGTVVTYNGAYYIVSAATASGVPDDEDTAFRQLTACLTGTGHAGSPTGDGTRDVLLASDGTHPTSEGSQALGTALAEFVLSDCAELARAPRWWLPATTSPLGVLSPRPAAPDPVFPSGGALAAQLLEGPGSTVAYAGYEYKDGSTRGGTSALRATEAYSDGFSALHLCMWRTSDGGNAAEGGRFVPSATWQLRTSDGTMEAIYSKTLAQCKALSLTSGSATDLEELASVLPSNRPVIFEYGPTSAGANPSAVNQRQEPAFWDEVVERFGAERVVALFWSAAEWSRTSLIANHPDVKRLVCFGSASEVADQAVEQADAVSGNAANFTADMWTQLAHYGKPTWAHNGATKSVVDVARTRWNEQRGWIVYNKACLGL